MAELADEWSSRGPAQHLGRPCPRWSRCRARAARPARCTARCRAGALTTTFTASQGLLLMIPNMYKIAGELTPAVFHVAARSLAAQALSIFGDHSDVMAVRQTGFALLASASVQEAHDLALVAQAATLGHAGAVRALLRRLPHLARAEHDRAALRRRPAGAGRPRSWSARIAAARSRPERPFIRGTAQNPDVYFQARETVNPFYARVPGDGRGGDGPASRRAPAATTGSFDYAGAPDAERVHRADGLGRRDRAARPSTRLNARGERVGVVAGAAVPAVPGRALLDALPASVAAIAVLDRTKEPGSLGEPLYLDVVAALAEARGRR